MRYLSVLLVVLVIAAAALGVPVATAYIINSDRMATIVGATTDGSLIYAYGATPDSGAIFVFDGFRLTQVYQLEGADWVYDSQYYNGYLYTLGSDGDVVMINVGNWQVSRQVNVGYVPTAIEKIGDQFYVVGYLKNESTGRYDTYISIFDLNLNLADKKMIQVYDYGGMVPLDVSYNGSHVAVVGYTRDLYSGAVYPVILYYDPVSGNYSYTIYTEVVGYGTSVDVCDGYFVAALGPRILFNGTLYDIGYNVTDVACYNGLIWFSYNEDGEVTGDAVTVVHVGYINLSDGSVTDVVAGYGRVYVYGDPVVYGNSVLFGGAAYCPECMETYPATAALFFVEPLDYVVEVRTVTATVTTTVTMVIETHETETVTETTTTVTEGYAPAPQDIILIGVVALLLTLALYVVLARRR